MNFEAWDKLFTETPDDWDSRLVYADWLEDENLPVLASGQRWQVTHKRYPAISMRPSVLDTTGEQWKTIQLAPPTWCWYSHNLLPQGYYSTTLQVWNHLCLSQRHLAFHHCYHYIIYSSRHQAEQALAYALQE